MDGRGKPLLSEVEKRCYSVVPGLVEVTNEIIECGGIGV
jgi:hypothetical protein